MPAVNAQKIYRANSYYHIYNRGAHKAPIFFNDEDYCYFGLILQKMAQKYPVYIRAFSVLPNHYHLLLFQQNPETIVAFMKSVALFYARYLRERYGHSGCVFQGVYKAALKRGEKQIREAEAYVLNNPAEAGLENWPYVGKNIFSFPTVAKANKTFLFPRVDLRQL